jgi:surfactin synthase thioesterase subunit
MNTNAWLLCGEAPKLTRSRLFCVPGAGADAAMFRWWSGLVLSGIEVCTVQLPGRGKRMREARVTRMDAVIFPLLEAMRDRLDLPFALFGDGLGASIAFELARALRRMLLAQPARLFLSGHRAPRLPSRFPELHRMPESDFRNALRQRGDVPAEVLEHEELMALVAPILRADFEIDETYKPSAEAPLDVPFTIFGRVADERVNASELDAWRELTRAAVRIEMLPGDRRYPDAEVVRTVGSELQRAMEQGS